jgi:NAD dependent epimerase/dehydratase family enzyme
MSWVHLDDHVRMTQFLLDSQAACGVYNVTAPNPVTNAEFTRLLAEQLHRPALIPLPAPLLKLAAGEMSELLLGSQRVLPRKAVAQGFKFNFETLEPALKHALSRQA